jgi:dihydroorotase
MSPPPLRLATDRAALIEALADGTIDCIGTEPRAAPRPEKEQPFAQAPNGGSVRDRPAVAAPVEPGLVPLATVSSGCRPARPPRSACAAGASR